MHKLYIDDILEKEISAYCKMNDIEDIIEFTNKCTRQGFNIIKFGTSPLNNINREANGIKDFNDVKIENSNIQNEPNEKEDVKDEDNAKKPKVSVRKIKVTKKD